MGMARPILASRHRRRARTKPRTNLTPVSTPPSDWESYATGGSVVIFLKSADFAHTTSGVRAISARSAASGVRSLEQRESALLLFYANYYGSQDGCSESDARREAGRVVGNLRGVIQEAHFAVTDPGELIAFGGAFCACKPYSFCLY